MLGSSDFRHVNNLWDDAAANALDPVGRLIYRTNLLGSDPRVTHTGGGSTSSKIEEKDPFTRQPVEVLWVKGSGGDLRTAKREDFASLYLDSVLSLEALYLETPAAGRGPKTPAENRVAAMYPHCTFNLNPCASGIDTALHAFAPARHVDHTHPNAVLAIAASENAERLTREIYGDEVIYTPWQRPGFDLGLVLRDLCRRHPQAKGVVLGQHGLINWADDDKECYELSLRLIERAADFIEKHDKGRQTFGGESHRRFDATAREETLARLLPWLRGQLARATGQRQIATVDFDETILRFVNSHDAPRLAELGTGCPDHLLRVGIKPLYVEWDPHTGNDESLRARLTAALERYRADRAGYYEQHRQPASPAPRDPNPTMLLLPGLGMIAWGKDKSESRVTAESYKGTVDVMRGAEAVDRYTALPHREAFDLEYGLPEAAGLQRTTPEQEMARKVVVIVGAGSGIGRELAGRVSKAGAHVVCVDVDQKSADVTAAELARSTGPGIGASGSGVSGCGYAVGYGASITSRPAIRQMLDYVALCYGGIDAIAVTAGVSYAPDPSGHISDDKWALTFSINVTGPYIVGDEAGKTWRDQGIPACLVLTTGADAVIPKNGSVAYDTSKAAANHLVRELAVELAPLVRVNGVAPATVVQGSRTFTRERVVASLARHSIAYNEGEDAEGLRHKLAQFYADRTLMRTPITPADQAEAMCLLLGDKLGKTTGQIIAVDGGLQEAFLR